MSETAFEQLVISRLETLQRGHDEIKREIVAVGTIAEQALNVSAQTLEQAKATNGRVTLLEGWQDSFEDETEVGVAFAAGRKSVRDGDRALAVKIGRLLGKWAPYGLAALMVGLGIRLGAWFLGGVW